MEAPVGIEVDDGQLGVDLGGLGEIVAQQLMDVPQRRAGRADDGSTEVAFIDEYNDFVRRMRAVDTVRIQFSVYQGGNILQEFNVRGFDPERM